ncbi:MAG: hypothetical protein MHMPM18_003734, partial [Marteilia pararefringens]
MLCDYRDLYYSGQWSSIDANRQFEITGGDKLILDVLRNDISVGELLEALKRE